jgi:hypothetical protein
VNSGTHVLLDPYLIAVPEKRENTHQYLVDLFEWLTALRSHREVCSVQQSTVAALLEEERFPTRECLARLLGGEDVSEFSLTT